MKRIRKFIEGKLKLKINQEKSRVGRSKDVKFLGMTIINGTAAISAQSMKRAMDKSYLRSRVRTRTHGSVGQTGVNGLPLTRWGKGGAGKKQTLSCKSFLNL
jgi:hypothetical protein